MSETATPPYVSYLRGRGWKVEQKTGLGSHVNFRYWRVIAPSWMRLGYFYPMRDAKVEVFAEALGYIPEVKK